MSYDDSKWLQSLHICETRWNFWATSQHENTGLPRSHTIKWTIRFMFEEITYQRLIIELWSKKCIYSPYSSASLPKTVLMNDTPKSNHGCKPLSSYSPSSLLLNVSSPAGHHVMFSGFSPEGHVSTEKFGNPMRNITTTKNTAEQEATGGLQIFIFGGKLQLNSAVMKFLKSF